MPTNRNHLAVQQNTVEEHAPQNALDVRLSTANRFLLRQMCLDFRRISTFDPTLDQVSRQSLTYGGSNPRQ